MKQKDLNMGSKKLTYLEEQILYTFKNKHLLVEAMTHKSFKQQYNNERLEFLGDSVLDLIIAQMLCEKFPLSHEGDLSKIRASLVNEKSLAKVANKIDLGEYLYMSVAEENSGGREKISILSDAFEAFVGAIYLDGGLEVVKQFSINLFNNVFSDISLKTLFVDYKTKLQEITQAKFGSIPEYKLINSFGPGHKREFEIAILINGQEYAKARAKSKKEAQQQCAKITLRELDE
jgi:ribonuclease-3